MGQVWLVELHTGAYEDRFNIAHKVFLSKEKADQCVEQLAAEIKERKLDGAVKISPYAEVFHGLHVDSNGVQVCATGPYELVE
jgi:hypothetical protein